MSPRAESTFLRPKDGRVIAGVCAAIARRTGIDVYVVRGVFVLLALCFGFGFALYLVLWMAIPED